MTTPTIQAQVLSLAPVNVIMYGATGDGVTDDTPAFTAANSAAAAAGQPIYLPAGRFALTNFASTTPIVGTGKDETVIIAGSSGAMAAVVSVYGTSVTPVNDWYITGVTIDGLSYEGGAQNLKLMYVTNVSISDCRFINSSQCGVYAANCTNLDVRHSYVYNCGMTTNAQTNKQGIGINVYDTSGFIFDNRIVQTGGAGIGATSYLSGAELGDIEIASNRVYNSGVMISEDNITAYAHQNQHIKVHHNFCNTSNNANMHIGSAYVEVTDNECINGAVSGISIATRYGNYDLLPVPSILVSGNIVTDSRADGIHLDSPCQSIIANNIVNTPADAGINITGNGRQLSIAGNVVWYPGSHGIEVAGVVDTTITGNVLTLLSSGAIQTLGAITPGSGYTPPWAPPAVTTTASGTGSVATLRYTGGTAPAIGRTIRVAGVTPTGYNGTYTVTPTAATTGASGTGSVATLTYSGAQPDVGDTIVVTGVVPAAYNGIVVVTASSPGSLSYASTATGAQTVAGTFTIIGTASYACTATGDQTVAGYITIVASTAAVWPNVPFTTSGSGVGASGDVIVNADGTIASISAATTGASGTGTIATVTFAGSAAVPIEMPVTIAGVTPPAYNGTYMPISSSVSGGVVSVSYASSATGGQTVAGTITGSGVVMRDRGKAYAVNDTLTIPPASVGGAGSGFSVPVSAVYGTPAGACLKNFAPMAGLPSSRNLLVVGNAFAGGLQAIGQDDAAASLVIGTNSVRYGGTNPYVLQGLDIVIGQTGFGGVNTGFATGSSVLATGSYSEAWGNGASSKARTGYRAVACGHFATQGDAQRGALVLRGATGASGTTCTLTADQNVLNPHNAANCNAASTLMGVSGRVIVSDATGANTARFQIEALYGSNAAANAVALMGSATASLMTSSGAGSGWTIAVTADSTNMAFKIDVSAAANCFAVARLDTEEMIW